MTGRFLRENGNVLNEGEIYDANFGGTGRAARVTYRGGDGNDFALHVDGPWQINFNADARVSREGDFVRFYDGSQVFASRLAASVTGVDLRRVTIIPSGGLGQPLTRGQVTLDPSLYSLALPDGIRVASAHDPIANLLLADGAASSVVHTIAKTGLQETQINTSTGTVVVRSTLVATIDDRLDSPIKRIQNRFGDIADWSLAEVSNRIQIQSGSMNDFSLRIDVPSNELEVSLGDGADKLRVEPIVENLNLEIYGDSGWDEVAFAGTIDLQSMLTDSELIKLNGGQLKTTGTQTFSGGTMDVVGTTQILSPHWIVNSNVDLDANRLSWSDRLTINGGVNLVAGTLVPPANIDGTGALTISAGTLDSNQNISIANLTLSGGSRTGTGTIEVTNHFEWRSGLLLGDGVTSISAGAIGSLRSSGHKHLHSTLRNLGTVIYDGTHVLFGYGGMTQPGRIENKPGATFTFSGAGSDFFHGGWGTDYAFVNEGTLIRTGAENSTLSVMRLINNGRLDVLNGTFVVGADSELLTTNSTLNIASEGTLQKAGNLDSQLQSPSNFTPNGTVLLNGGRLEAMSRDRGPIAVGFIRNFKFNQLRIDSGSVVLSDAFDNALGVTPEAIYTESITVAANATLDLNGRNLYTRSSSILGQVVNGSITLVTEQMVAPTDIVLSPSQIQENSVPGSMIGAFFSADINIEDEFSYQLVSGDGDQDNQHFTVSAGRLHASTSFNFESKSSYSVRLRSTDLAWLSFEKALIVSVTNVNEAPTNISLSATSIAENAASNATVGTLASVDPDAGGSFVYTLVAGEGSTDNAAFSISGNSLLATASFDFEAKSSYTIRLRTTDQEGLFFERAFTINVINVNEPVALTRSIALVAGNVQSILTNTGTWSDPESGTVTLSASLGTVTKNANGTWNWAFTPNVGGFNQVVTISANDGTNVSSTTFNLTAYTTIATRGIQYGGATGTSASTSLAADKVALLPGQSSTYANYTNYSRGLNGLVIDVVGLPASVTAEQIAASLQFANWNGIAASGFVALPVAAVPSVAIVAGGCLVRHALGSLSRTTPFGIPGCE